MIFRILLGVSGILFVISGLYCILPSLKAAVLKVREYLLFRRELRGVNQALKVSPSKKVYGFFQTVMGLLLALSGMLGPLWPTELAFDNQALYQDGSFGLPVQLVNSSKLFDIVIDQGICRVATSSFALKDFGEDFSTVENNFDLSGNIQNGLLKAGEKKSFICDAIGEKIQPTYYQMKVDIKYHYSLMPYYSRHLISNSLVWDNNHFYEGEKIN